ncbi:MAG: 3-deoxy-8-phosphooctulonate synthase [Blastocatellia bacterium]|jgi:2-dehydro-3-deoxyphosphooctonate aldolase (KDO 8-P synthase)|nr:3-deoxy-8-phosphooctulonate synthase [Blastocatellia bacterium]MBK6428226.1 3-deoxy-8-phosphooctulonate synthase [Blastocatellia bacterium]
MPTNVTSFDIGPVRAGGPDLFLVAGPCVIESERHARSMAERIARIAADAGVPYVFKASFDKANRTSISSFRGPGIEDGLRILQSIQRDVGVPVLTDVHEVWQAERAGDVVDVLQIPAFLCRQTDLLIAAAKTGRAVNVKKGQFLAPWDMKNVVDKMSEAGCERLSLTERGSSFGYNALVVDMRGFPIMRRFGWPVVYDVTHSLQKPGGLGGASGGDSEFIEYLARAGVACGVDGVFMEVHDNPAAALSDGPNALPLERLAPLLDSLTRIHRIAREVA